MKNRNALLIVGLAGLIVLTACTITIGGPAATPTAPPPVQPPPGQPLGEQPPPGQPPGEQPPGGAQPGEPQVIFMADRTNIRRGECATLEWGVPGQGEVVVELNGQRVNRSGTRQVCPQETTSYVLHVDLGTTVRRPEILIVVGEGGGQPPPQPQPPTSQPPPPPTSPPSGSGCPGAPVFTSFTANPSTITAGQSSTLSWGNVTNGATGALVASLKLEPGFGEVGSGASQRNVKPNQTTTYTLTATGCGGTATKQVTVVVGQPTATLPQAKIVLPDLAITNVYAKQDEGWKLKVTIKNTGQGDLTNAGGSRSCSMSWIPTGSKTGKSQSATGFFNVTLKVGQETTLDTGFTLSDVAYYDVTCSISPSILDTNSGNNSKTVKITRGP